MKYKLDVHYNAVYTLEGSFTSTNYRCKVYLIFITISLEANFN